MHPQELIKEALAKSKHPAIGFSGGKDSIVVLNLVREIDPSVVAVFGNTGVEAPETVKFCRNIPNLVELKPHKTFWECVDQYGWPMIKSKAKSHGNRCCYYLKEQPMLEYIKENNIDLVFTGLTSDESRARWLFFKRCGPYYYMKTWGVWKCHPIHDWTVKDVWDYIHDKNIPYNPIYDRGAVRAGCQPCTAYTSWKKRLANENPKMLKVVLKKQGQWQLDAFECDGGA